MARRKRRESSTAADSGLEDGALVPLADGPVASVLAGIDHVTGEAFALKVYPGKLDRTVRAELEAEYSRLWPLRTRTPVLIGDRVQYHEGKCAVRMELAAQSLPELISAFGQLSVPDALALGESVATALAAAHRVGVVHGGVTPGNVLFRPSGEAVLSDFGLALRNAFPQDAARDVSFLAPETVRDGTADERSDIYGIGAILYLALSAQPPHAGRLGEQTGERLLRVLDSTPPPLTRTDLPQGLPVLLSALLAKDPHARPMDAAEVAARLGAMGTSGHPVPVTQQAAGTRSAQPSAATGVGFDDFAAAPTYASPWSRPQSTPPQVVPPTQEQPAVPSLDSDTVVSRPARPKPEPSEDKPVQAAADLSDPDRTQAIPGTHMSQTTISVPRDMVRSADGGSMGRGLTGAPSGQQVLVFRATRPQRRITSGMIVLAAAGALCIGVLIALIMLLNRPDELPLQSAPVDVGTASSSEEDKVEPVEVTLAKPVDKGKFVQLSWDSSMPLDYAVIVAGKGEKAKALLTHEKKTLRVEVDPKREYCFAVQGADSNGVVYESDPQAIRGASCAR